MRVMLVEDDRSVAGALVDALTQHQHQTRWCRTGAEAIRGHHDSELVLLDLGLPDTDGLLVLRQLRQVSSVPVLVLTARGDERSVVRGLRAGADDYLVKPVRLRELLARIEAVSRRARPAPEAEPDARVCLADLEVDLRARTVHVAGAPVELTTKEFDVLAVLARRPGEAVSRQQIMDQVWGDAFLAVSRALDVHISTVRTKLDRPRLLHTIRGFGYRLG